jgi:hypothetical protein
VVLPSRATRQGCKLGKLIKLFWNISQKRENMSLKVVLERLGDISAVCSHCCFIVQDHVICMFLVIDVWTEF